MKPSWKAVPPTCTEPGTIEHWVNPEDGSIYLDEQGTKPATEADIVVPALGHDWSDWEVVTEPITEAEGLERRTCRHCGEVEERAIPKLDPEPTPAPTPKPKPKPNVVPKTADAGLVAGAALLVQLGVCSLAAGKALRKRS